MSTMKAMALVNCRMNPETGLSFAELGAEASLPDESEPEVIPIEGLGPFDVGDKNGYAVKGGRHGHQGFKEVQAARQLRRMRSSPGR